jgi:hypothetical protein
VADFEYARGNSDAPTSLVNDDTSALRASDHDGIVLFISKNDIDNDNVIDSLDMCPGTTIPETLPSKGLNPNHFALVDADGTFDTEGETKDIFTISDTAGCSCEQIIDKLSLGNGHKKYGCSVGVMSNWTRKVNP